MSGIINVRLLRDAVVVVTDAIPIPKGSGKADVDVSIAPLNQAMSVMLFSGFPPLKTITQILARNPRSIDNVSLQRALEIAIRKGAQLEPEGGPTYQLAIVGITDGGGKGFTVSPPTPASRPKLLRIVERFISPPIPLAMDNASLEDACFSLLVAARQQWQMSPTRIAPHVMVNVLTSRGMGGTIAPTNSSDEDIHRTVEMVISQIKTGPRERQN